MLFLILISCIELCFDDVTVVSGSTKAQVLYGFDIFFTITFGVEVKTKYLLSDTFSLNRLTG